MRKFAGFLITACLTAASLPALTPIYSYSTNPNAPGANWPSPINMNIGIGYRQDEFCWSVVGEDESPGFSSVLKWKELQMIEVSGFASYTSCRNYYVRVNGDYGYICSGKNIDSDYSDNDRENLFLRSENNAGKGYVYDLDGAVGYRFTSTCGRFVGMPIVGCSFHSQHLTAFDGETVFFHGDRSVREIPDLNNVYKARWLGPYVGVDFSARVEGCAYVFGTIQGHWASYRGSGKWNMNPVLAGFHDRAHGWGYLLTLGGNWEIWDHWSIGLQSTYRYFRTHEGVQTNVHNLPLIGKVESEKEFRHARWSSLDGEVVIVWRF